ncbi:arylsulfatase B [Ixodes scapularis]
MAVHHLWRQTPGELFYREGWDDVSFHGSPQIPTPNMDVLAADGIILNHYYVQPACTPSRAALMTGLYPIHTGMQHSVLVPAQPYGLPLEVTIMPQHFKNLGYETHMIGKGWDDVSFHGSPQIPTPNMDVLAADGIILNNYYVQPVCTPSRAALMTGLYPIHTGMQHSVLMPAQPYGLPLEVTIMPQHFKNLGYETHMIGKVITRAIRKETEGEKERTACGDV